MLDAEMETRLKPPAASGAQQGSSLFTHFEDVQVAENMLYIRVRTFYEALVNLMEWICNIK